MAEINANRDWGGTVKLWRFDIPTGKKVPRDTGTPFTFISTTKETTTAAPLSGLQVNLTHVANEDWSFGFDGAALTDAVLSQLPGGVGYCIFVETGDEWSYVPLEYVNAKLASVR